MTNLRVYAGSEHPHEAQSPEVLDAKSEPKNTRTHHNERRTILGDLEAVAGGAEAVVEIAAPREPVRMTVHMQQVSVKMPLPVWIKPGSGKVMVNGKELTLFAVQCCK